MEKRQETIAILLAMAACLIWGGSFVIARGVHEWIAPITLAFYRWVVAFIALLALSYKDIAPQFNVVKKNLPYIILMGIVGVACFNTIVYFAAHYTSAHHISLISSLSPVLTLIFAAWAGFDRFTSSKALGAVTAVVGTAIVVSRGDMEVLSNLEWNKGDVLMILSALIWAVWSVLLHKKPKELESRIFLLSQVFVGTVVLLPFYIWEVYNIQATEFSLRSFEIYLYLGVASSVAAWLAWQYCNNIIGAVRTSMIYYTLPVFAGIMAVIFLGEEFKLYHVLGFVLIFFGIVISNVKEKNYLARKV